MNKLTVKGKAKCNRFNNCMQSFYKPRKIIYKCGKQFVKGFGVEIEDKLKKVGIHALNDKQKLQ